MPKNASEPLYLTGILKLHGDFEKAVRRASEISLKYIPKNDAYIKRLSSNLYGLRGCLLVDFNQEQLQNALTGYFIFDRVVHRFLSVTVEYPFFFPVIDYSQDKTLSKGIKYGDIESMIIAKKTIVFAYNSIPNTSGEEGIFFNTNACINIENTVVAPKDDVGMPFCSFKDIDELCLKDIPNSLLKCEYTVVGTSYYAPYTTDEESYCVLFAQLDNPYDSHAIKLLRWFPQAKKFDTSQSKYFWGDVLYEMGYISRNENTELYQFMTECKARILFGKKIGNKVTLIGSVKMFLSKKINYPKCLLNIEVR